MRTRVVTEATWKIINAIGVPVEVINKANVEIIYCSKKEAGLHLGRCYPSIGRYLKSGIILLHQILNIRK